MLLQVLQHTKKKHTFEHSTEPLKLTENILQILVLKQSSENVPLTALVWWHLH